MAKINNVTKLLVIKKVVSTLKDGKEYFKLVVLQGDNAETFGCPKEVFDMVEEYKEYNFITEYNTDYKSFRIVGLINNNK